jgi:hypothetical protein
MPNMERLEFSDGSTLEGGSAERLGKCELDAPQTIAPLTITYSEAARIATMNLETSVQRCVCGWFDREYTFPVCPNCGTSLQELTDWWREMDDRFWGMSKEELREDFESWRILSAEIISN